MTTIRQRLEALDDIARTSGKSREEVFRIVAPSWRLDLGDLSVLREAMARTPEPVARVTRTGEDPRALADHAHARALADHAVADIAAFRSWSELRATNPHGAALLMNRNADQIQRGRVLDAEPQDDGPQAA